MADKQIKLDEERKTRRRKIPHISMRTNEPFIYINAYDKKRAPIYRTHFCVDNREDSRHMNFLFTLYLMLKTE